MKISAQFGRRRKEKKKKERISLKFSEAEKIKK